MDGTWELSMVKNQKKGDKWAASMSWRAKVYLVGNGELLRDSQ